MCMGVHMTVRAQLAARSHFCVVPGNQAQVDRIVGKCPLSADISTVQALHLKTFPNGLCVGEGY